MKIVFAIVPALALAACTGPVPQGAPPALVTAVVPPWVSPKPAAPYPPPKRDGSRLPLPGDTGFAWDKLNHRGQVRWECRSTPSGQFVRQSFCAGLPQADGPRPAAFSDLEGWMGVIYTD
jgi:hypothetical protein